MIHSRPGSRQLAFLGDRSSDMIGSFANSPHVQHAKPRIGTPSPRVGTPSPRRLNPNLGDIQCWRNGLGADVRADVMRSSDVIGRHYSCRPLTPRIASPRTPAVWRQATQGGGDPSQELVGNAIARSVAERQRFADQNRKLEMHQFTNEKMEVEVYDSIFGNRFAHKDTEESIGHDLVPLIDPRARLVRPKVCCDACDRLQCMDLRTHPSLQ